MSGETKKTQDDETVSVADLDENAVWTEHHENILIEWADKATCYRWLHAKSHIDYSKPRCSFHLPSFESKNAVKAA